MSIVQGDVFRLPFSDDSFDLVVTSPPFWRQRTYKSNGSIIHGQLGREATADKFIDRLVSATEEMARVVCDDGNIWVNLGDKTEKGSLLGIPWRYALAVQQRLGLLIADELIWEKPNAMPSPSPRKLNRTHEHWFRFTKQSLAFANIDLLRSPHKSLGDTLKRTKMYNKGNDNPIYGGNLNSNKRSRLDYYHPQGKAPPSVWIVQTEPWKPPAHLEQHHASFPMEIVRRLVVGFSRLGAKVLDPFGGSGTVAAVANALERFGVSLDLGWSYCELARWRVFESPHADWMLERVEGKRKLKGTVML